MVVVCLQYTTSISILIQYVANTQLPPSGRAEGGVKLTYQYVHNKFIVRVVLVCLSCVYCIFVVCVSIYWRCIACLSHVHTMRVTCVCVYIACPF